MGPGEFGGYVWSAEQMHIVPVVAEQYFTEQDSLEQILERAPEVNGNLIFISHAPPAKSNLDLLYGGLHVGSKAVRQYIERVRPVVSFHGHIHESPRGDRACL